MAKKKGNERCPLQSECKKVCLWQNHELDCDYYHSFARPGYEIEDQETIRFKRIDEAMMAAYEADDYDGEDDAESPLAAEYASVSPVDAFDEVSVFPESLHLDGSNGVTEKIRRAMFDAARQFVYIGFLLWEVQEYGYYMEKGYASVYEYAERELGFKKSSTKNFIAINYQFGSRDGRPCGIAHERTMTLQPKYEQFNYSQLCEMLSMSDKQREKVTPDMTVKQIRELKKEGEPDLPPNMETIPIPFSDDPVPSGQTSGRMGSRKRPYHVVNGRLWLLDEEKLKWFVECTSIPFDSKARYDITITLHKDT